MVTASNFLKTNNFVSFQIFHYDYGSFQATLCGNDTTPHGRLYIVSEESGEGSSCICRKGTAEKVHSYRWERDEMVLSKEGMDLEAGRIYLIPPYYDLEYRFRRGLKMWAIHFSLEHYPGLDIFSSCHDLRSLPDTEGLARILNIQKTDGSRRTMIIQKGLFLTATGLFLNDDEDMASTLVTRRKYGVLLTWLRDNIRAGLRIKDLADVQGWSTDYFSRQFSKDMEVPVKTYINRELVKEATARLIFSGKRTKEIAEDLHFNDEYYFNRFFKKQTGLTPGEYLKNYKSAPSDINY